ncbi:hypothetical protein IMCC9480_2957 [Oxalobacteraceae bacterium IMCC9480]|nr:hypothetical protein IMCC9480_2957 [Oxalobacteraceae bacterium IMCC9480]
MLCGGDGSANIENFRNVEQLVDLAREALMAVQYMSTDEDIVANARKAIEMQVAMGK